MGPSEGTFEDQLSPETDYVAVAFGLAVLEDGSAFTSTTDLFKKEFTSDEMPPLEEDYAAWIGTWEVTSTTSEKTQSPLTFMVTFSVKVPNNTLNMTGLSSQHPSRRITSCLPSSILKRAVMPESSCSRHFWRHDGRYSCN